MQVYGYRKTLFYFFGLTVFLNFKYKELEVPLRSSTNSLIPPTNIIGLVGNLKKNIRDDAVSVDRSLPI